MSKIKKIFFETLMGRVSFWICLVTTIALGIAGFFVPPMGVIDGSLLAFCAYLFGFATLAIVADAIKEGYDAKVNEAKTREAERMALDARTIDAVQTGEQQPEIDHRMQVGRSSKGNNQGEAYRQAMGSWFSYELENKGETELALMLRELRQHREVNVAPDDEGHGQRLVEMPPNGPVRHRRFTADDLRHPSDGGTDFNNGLLPGPALIRHHVADDRDGLAVLRQRGVEFLLVRHA